MRAIGLLACALPRRLALAIAEGFGHLVWRLYRLTPVRDFVPTTLRTAWPQLTEREVDRLGSRSLALLTCSIAEVMRFALLENEIEDIVEVVDGHHLEGALAGGSGAIIATAHFGNWELLGAALARKFRPLSVLVQTPSQDAFARLFVEYRRKVGVTTYANSGPQSLRPAIRALREGQLLGLLCDQHGAAREGRGKLLGQPVWVPLGPFTLSRRTGAPIVPARLVRGSDQRHRLILDPPLSVDPDPDVNAQRLLDRYSEWIERDPDHWLWAHNRWEFLAQEAQVAQVAPEPPPEHPASKALGVLAAGLLLLSARPALALGLEHPLLVSYPRRLEVVDALDPDTHGDVPLPGAADAALRLHDRDALVVHVPTASEVAIVDLEPFSVSRFQVVKRFVAPELAVYDVGLEEAAGHVLLGFERTVVADFDEKTWTARIGFDRPDEIPYPFSSGKTLYLPGGVFVLHQGDLAFEDPALDSQGEAADAEPIRLLRRPTAMIADPAGDAVYVAEAGQDARGFLAHLDPTDVRIVQEVAAPAPLTSLAWVDYRTLAVQAGARIGLFDTRKGTFVRWFTLPDGPPLRLLSAR